MKIICEKKMWWLVVKKKDQNRERRSDFQLRYRETVKIKIMTGTYRYEKTIFVAICSRLSTPFPFLGSMTPSTRIIIAATTATTNDASIIIIIITRGRVILM